MKYWVNVESSSNNVVILSEGTVVIGSCEQDEVSFVEAKLQSNTDYSAVFGTDNFTVISFSQLQYVASRSTDEDIDVEYKIKKELETLSINFIDQQSRAEFLSALEDKLPNTFKKKEVQQSRFGAAVPSLLAFICGAGISALYWNKLRWVTIFVGGLWLLVSAYSFYTRITNPPIVTTLSTRNVVGSAWQKIKFAGSLALLAIIVLAFSSLFPDSYGDKALGQHIDAEQLTAEKLTVLVSRGSDINSVSDFGWTALHQAISEDNLSLFSTAIAEGADPFIDVEDMETPIDYLISYERADMLEAFLASSWKPNDLGSLMPKVIASTDDTKMLAVLYDYGLSPKAQDKDGNNALQLAVINGGDYDLVSFLVEKGVPSNVQVAGSSLADYALENGYENVAKLFSDEPRDFAKDKELTAKIDTYFLEKLKAQMENSSPIVKMIMNSDGGMSDADYQEMVDESTGALQYKSMISWGNNLVMSIYAHRCGGIGFDQADELNKVINAYGKTNLGDIQIADSIFMRNRSVYIESKGAFVVPQEIKLKYMDSHDKLVMQFDAAGDQERKDLLGKCRGLLERMSKKDKS